MTLRQLVVRMLAVIVRETAALRDAGGSGCAGDVGLPPTITCASTATRPSNHPSLSTRERPRRCGSPTPCPRGRRCALTNGLRIRRLDRNCVIGNSHRFALHALKLAWRQ